MYKIDCLVHRCDLRALETELLLDGVRPTDLDALLYEATRLAWPEGVALLLLLGADPRHEQPSALNAFELCITHLHGQWRPRYEYLMRLLEHRPPNPSEQHYHERVGRDVDAPLDGVGPHGIGNDEAQLAHKQTAVHFAVEHDYVYGLLWLVEQRGARLDLVNADGLNAIGLAMRSVDLSIPGTRHCARACFVLLELLLVRYAQDPRPYAELFPIGMAAVRSFAARRVNASTRRRVTAPRVDGEEVEDAYADEYAKLRRCVQRLDAGVRLPLISASEADTPPV